ncbi:hypothetical protein C7M84_002004 [Penaeus vannamei]|uniref:Uncharacterized protein n=1 Tax=Penaeus vannamei TaxID=6689 RepID=A0A423TS84_PENVA|nr:microtubule cross-linking factor 1-like isoform X2 [Penaeus vannamei]ROT79282.1 hypothetical protein C7M84_002004 [Penaeus vannamei]
MKKGKDSLAGGGASDGVTLRRPLGTATPAPTTPSPYSFMRRSCTFVAESSLGLRKSALRTSLTNHGSSARTPAPAVNKVVKDRKNLAMQVRQKKELLEESANGHTESDNVTGRGGGGSGRVSRLVGGLRAWSSTEDVRQSVMGAIGRTVSVSRRVKQAFSRPDNSKPDTAKAQSTKANQAKANADTTKAKSSNVNGTKAAKGQSTKPADTAFIRKKQAEKAKPSKPLPGKLQVEKPEAGRPKSSPSASSAAGTAATNSRWFRHIQEAQEAYGARDGRNRRSQPPTPLPDPDDHPGSSGDALRDVDDDVDGGETADGTNDISGDTKAQSGSGKATEPAVKPEEPLSSTSTASQPPASSETLANKTEADGASSGSSGPGGPSPSAGRSPASGRRLQEVQIIQIVEGPTLIQPSEVKVSQGVVLSAEPVLTPIEHLRRKDLKIRQALEEKQHIIADILNIPHEHFENVADMAGEPAVGNKEPRELVLAAMYQAKCLQETLNEALNIRESDIVAARANNDSANKLSSLPLYQAPMTKLMAISTSLSQQLSSLLNLVSERDDERDRMRKELVASRERLHLLHMRQNSLTNQTSTSTHHSDITTSTSTTAATPPTATSPHTSRPSSFVSVASSVPDHSDSLDHHDTDEEGRGDAPKVNSTHQEEGEDSKEGSVAETFEDAVSGSEPADTAAGEGEHSSGNRECLGDGAAVRGPEGITESSTT